MSFSVLFIVGGAQFAFAVLLTVFLFIHRAGAERHTRDETAGAAVIDGPLNAWLVGQGTLEDVCLALDTLSPSAARSAALHLGRDRLNPEAGNALADALQHRGWLLDGFAQTSSPWWWHRLEAARLIAELGTVNQERFVRRLLNDSHAAVRIAATNCLVRIANPALIEIVLNELPRQPIVLRSTQLALLRAQWQLARDGVLPRLTMHADPRALPHWINVAEALGTADVLAKVVELHTHAEPLVRINVARALKKYFHADSPRVLSLLLNDRDWRVRAQAARSFGVLNEVSAAPALAARLGDEAWWVRFRSALALAQLGEKGRAALRAARESSDPVASQMASMVSGLSDGSVVELIEG